MLTKIFYHSSDLFPLRAHFGEDLVYTTTPPTEPENHPPPVTHTPHPSPPRKVSIVRSLSAPKSTLHSTRPVTEPRGKSHYAAKSPHAWSYVPAVFKKVIGNPSVHPAENVSLFPDTFEAGK